MMREIKYRMWDTEHNRMTTTEEDLAKESYGNVTLAISIGGGIEAVISDSSGTVLSDSLDGVLVANRFELMQYTGLKDKNGVEIYEGDIIEFTVWWFDGNVHRDTNLKGAVEYVPRNMSFQLKNVRNKKYQSYTGFTDADEYYTPFSELDFDDADFTVIGNIYENPNILEQNK